MTTRYTKRDAEGAFNRLREALEKPLASDFGIHDPQREGAWLLDHNSVYGGYVIAEIVADSPPRPGEDRPQAYTAENRPFGHERRTAREFVDFVSAVMRGMALKS